MQPTKDSEKMQNFCGIRLDNLDFTVVEATLASIETKSLTPIIKEELKLKIQTQRLAAGKSELPTPVFKEPEKCELTPEEEIKRDHRRERNRIAAAKCRNKRKSQSEKMKTTLAEEQLKNFTLKRKVEELENEKNDIIQKLKLQQIFATPSPQKQRQQEHPQTHQQQQQQQETSPTYCSPISSPSPSPVPISPPPFTNLPLNQTSFSNMPSTSSGIFDQAEIAPMSRRYSEDLPRNLGAVNYIPRRFSAESCQYFSTYNSQQNETVEPAQTFHNEGNTPNTSNEFDKLLSNTKSFQSSENEASTHQDLEIDILSDEEFFRFENETIPFEQYQSETLPHISSPSTVSGGMVTTDGGIKLDNKVQNTEYIETHVGPEEHHPYLMNLIPVFEDEAMVPEGNDADPFAVSPGPTSPSFY